jgi:hypothetical protein
MINGSGWVINLWSKLSTNNPGGISKKFFDYFHVKRQMILNRFLVLTVILVNLIMYLALSQDLGRLYLWCCLGMIFYLALLASFIVPMTIDLGFLILFIRKRDQRIAGPRGSDVMTALSRFFLTTLLLSLLALIAIFETYSGIIQKKISRVSQNMTPEQVNAVGDGIFVGQGISPNVISYSLTTLFQSIPFLFHKEFLPIMLGRYYGTPKDSTVTQQVSIEKSGTA